MECAIKVFSRRGIGRAGHAEIAELAGVSVATVFNYFNTREDLVDDVLSEVEQRLMALVNSAFVGGRPALESVNEYISSLVDATYLQSDVIHIGLEWSSSVREDVWPRFIKLQGKLDDMIGQTLQSGFDNGEFTCAMSATNAARALHAAVYLAVQMVNRPEQPTKEEVIDFISDYVMSLLRPTK
jgi:TetR/AcrR family hemagglutinin/protease transcriptional regulator